MTNVEVLRVLRNYEVYDDLFEWVESHGGPLEELWRDCQDGALMLRLAVTVEVDRHAVVKAACACARTALQYVPAGEERPRRAIERAEAWARGEETLETVRAAADAARVVAGEPHLLCATRAAASAAASAATAAYTAVITATDAAYIAANAVFATRAAAGDAVSVFAATAAYTVATMAAGTYDAAAAVAAMNDVEIAQAQALANCAQIVRAYISADVLRGAIRASVTAPDIA